MLLPRDILPTALSGIAFIITIALIKYPHCCTTLQPKYWGWAWAEEQWLLIELLKGYLCMGKLFVSVKAERNGHFVTVWCFWNADILAKEIISWPAHKTMQGRQLCPKMQWKLSWGSHCTHWQDRDVLMRFYKEAPSSYSQSCMTVNLSALYIEGLRLSKPC